MSVPVIFNPNLIAARRQNVAQHDEFAPPLHRHAMEDLAERILSLERTFPLALEIGTGAASLHNTQAKSRIKKLFACDSAYAVAKQAARHGAFVAPQEILPLAPQCLDLVVSLMCLHHVNDLPGALLQSKCALRDKGIFLSALFGEGTLEELRTVLLEAELEDGLEPKPRVAPFASLQTLGNLLARAGFLNSVADIERLRLQYDSLAAVIHDLRNMAETNSLAAPRSPLPRRVLARAEAIYSERFPHPDGGIQASFSIVYLIGHSPHA